MTTVRLDLGEDGSAAPRTLGEALARAGLQLVEQAPAVAIVPGRPGLVAVARRGDADAVLALADAVDRRSSTALLEAGAAGIALSSAPAEAIAHAVRAVAAGFVVVPAESRATLVRAVLTARQQQILSLLVLGLDNGTIARRLYLTESTVKTHLTAIFSKLGVRSRREAVDLVLDPASGLGDGVLSLRGTAPRGSGGYEPPEVTP